MKTKLAILVLVLVAVLVATAPVSAEANLVGDQISVTVPVQQFPAEEPFHIRHGWVGTPGAAGSCTLAWDFLLAY